METPINEHVMREMLNERQSARQKYLTSLASLPSDNLRAAAANKGLQVFEGESAMQVITRIVDCAYPELNDVLPGAGFTPTEVSDSTRVNFETVERAAPNEFPHMAWRCPSVEVGYRALDGDKQPVLHNFDVDEYTYKPDGNLDTIIIAIPHHWMDKGYVKQFVKDVYRAAVSGEPENVIEMVNQIKSEQGWADGYLNPDMTEDAMLDHQPVQPDAAVAGYVYHPPVGEAATAFLPAPGTPEFEAEVQRRQNERSPLADTSTDISGPEWDRPAHME